MQSEHPFNYLLSLEKAILSRVPGLPLCEIPKEDWIGVVFLSGAQILLTPLEEVVEILRVPLLEAIPGVKPWIRGMVSCQDQIFPVTDLQGFLTQKISPITSESRILVISHQEEYSGILVDRVLNLQHVAKEERKQNKDISIPEYNPFIVEFFSNEDLEFPIISCRAIIQHPRFRDVAVRKDE